MISPLLIFCNVCSISLTICSFELAILYQNIPNDIKENLLGPYLSIEKNLVRFNTRVIDSMNIERNELIKKIQYDLENKLKLKKNEFK